MANHGTVKAYKTGCWCKVCTEWMAQRQQHYLLLSKVLGLDTPEGVVG